MAAESEYWKRFWTKRVNRRRLIKASAVGGAGLAAAGVVGCGDDDDDTGEATATPTEGPTGEATPTPGEETPVAGGTLTGPLVGLSTGNPPSLDAIRQLTFLAQIPAAYHYNRLVKFVPPDTTDVNGYPSVPIDFSEVEGDACEMPEVIDEVTFNFTLRDGLTFHDIAPVSGRAVTIDDLKASIDTFATESPNRGNWLAQVSETTVEDGNLVVTLRGPFAPSFQVLFGNTDGGPWLYPTEVLEDETLSNTRPIGAGPFVLDSWEEGVALNYSKHPNYYEAGKPYIDGFTASLVGDPQVILENLKSGTFDTSLWSAERWNEAIGELPDHQFYTGPEHVWGGAYFNFALPPFNDVRVRQALSMSINRSEILAAIDEPGAAGGSGLTHISQFANFWMDPINDASTFGDNAQYYQYDIPAAEALLGQAGVGDLDLTAVTSSVYGAGFLTQMQAVTSSIAAAGFNAEINQQEYGAYISTTFFGALNDNEFGLAPLMGSPMDPHNIFFTIFHPTSVRHNYGPQFPNPGDTENHAFPADSLPVAGDAGPAGDGDLLAAFSAQATELDVDARIEMVRDIQRMMAESMYFVPWTGVSTAYAFAPHVRGIKLIRGYGYGAEVAPNLWIAQS